METVNSVAQAAARAVWGEGNETNNQEPVSGQTGNVRSGEPYDGGNLDNQTQNRIVGSNDNTTTSNTNTTSGVPTSTGNAGTTTGAGSTTGVGSSTDFGSTTATGSTSAVGTGADTPSSTGLSGTRDTTETTGSSTTTTTTTDTNNRTTSIDDSKVEPSSKTGHDSSAQQTTPKEDNPEEEPPADVTGSGPRPVAELAKEHGGDAGAVGTEGGDNSNTGTDEGDVGDSSHPGQRGGGSISGESKGTGEQWVKSSGLHADGGDFDATAPGAGREADRLMEEKGIVTSTTDKKDTSSASSGGAGAHEGGDKSSSDKPSIGERIKAKLHKD